MLLEVLSRQTGIPRDSLLRFGRSAGVRYKSYEIDKRNGGKRLIEQPSKSVKMMQYILIESIFSKYPVHHSSYGYIKGRSILDNANAHEGYNFTTRLDFKDFFWSFTRRDIIRFMMVKKLENVILNHQDIEFVASVSSRKDRLAMGAPSSPILTNIIMYDLDKEIYEICQTRKVKYTRYADDIFISSNEKNVLGEVVKNLMISTKNYQLCKLELNCEKTSFLSRKHHREITGLVIKPTGGISIGRDKKRKISSLIHESLIGKLSKEDSQKLSGYLSWAYSAEPNFIISMEKKYGTENIKKIRLQIWAG